MNESWSMYNIWNESLGIREERPFEKRNHIWASELGGSMVDRYLKMNAVPPSNPPNPRSLRKFEAGNVWEWIIGLVLKRAGIFIEPDGVEEGKPANHVRFQYEGLLEVTGKTDFIAGGKPDWEKAMFEIEALGLPTNISYATKKIVETLQAKFPNGLKEIVLEIKSCSAFMFELYERSGIGSPNHHLQLFHYLKGKNMDEGHVVYICKDDARMLEIGIFNPSPTEDLYRRDIQTISHYVLSGKQPPLEKNVVFDYQFGRFSANWKVAYSGYLKMLYGYESQFEFDEENKPMVERWNRVLKRVAKGDKMTDKNIVVVDEIKAKYPDYEELVKACFKNLPKVENENS